MPNNEPDINWHLPDSVTLEDGSKWYESRFFLEESAFWQYAIANNLEAINAANSALGNPLVIEELVRNRFFILPAEVTGRIAGEAEGRFLHPEIDSIIREDRINMIARSAASPGIWTSIQGISFMNREGVRLPTSDFFRSDSEWMPLLRAGILQLEYMALGTQIIILHSTIQDILRNACDDDLGFFLENGAEVFGVIRHPRVPFLATNYRRFTYMLGEFPTSLLIGEKNPDSFSNPYWGGRAIAHLSEIYTLLHLKATECGGWDSAVDYYLKGDPPDKTPIDYAALRMFDRGVHDRDLWINTIKGMKKELRVGNSIERALAHIDPGARNRELLLKSIQHADELAENGYETA